MRIGINATSLNDRPSGAKQRFVGLYGALFAATPNHDYLIYEPRDCQVAGWFADLANVRGMATPMPSEGRWPRFVGGLGYWRRQLAQDRLDLFETLHLPLIRAPHCPTLLTIHDARAVLSDVPVMLRTLYRQMLGRALRQADHVITVSDTIRAELLGIEPGARITTIYNGVAPGRIAPQPGATAATPHPPAKYLLAVGHFEPRKNYPLLLAAMALLRHSHPDLGLVIVGKEGGTLAETTALVDRLGLGSSVRLLTGVDDEALATLYRGAKMLVFPSTYEGFGIPLLEAMAAGVPLALSDVAVFRELSESHASYFDPHDPAAIAAAISGLLASTAHQAAQRAYGRRRIDDFAFASLAGQLAGLHCRLAAAAPRARDDVRSPPSPGTGAGSSLTRDRRAARERQP